MNTRQLRAFDELKEAWLAHHDLQTAHAPISDLAASRTRLDSARISALRHLH